MRSRAPPAQPAHPGEGAERHGAGNWPLWRRQSHGTDIALRAGWSMTRAGSRRPARPIDGWAYTSATDISGYRSEDGRRPARR